MTNEYPNIFALENFYKYLDKWIYSSKYIRIYSNIQICVPHWWIDGQKWPQSVKKKIKKGNDGEVMLSEVMCSFNSVVQLIKHMFKFFVVCKILHLTAFLNPGGPQSVTD